jgi:Leucine-rich repeat (LRR) protein
MGGVGGKPEPYRSDSDSERKNRYRRPSTSAKAPSAEEYMAAVAVQTAAVPVLAADVREKVRGAEKTHVLDMEGLIGKGAGDLPLEIFEQCSALTSLNLNRNQLTALPAGLRLLTALNVLRLNANRLESIQTDVLSPLTALQLLDLGRNHFVELPRAIQQLVRCRLRFRIWSRLFCGIIFYAF